MAKLLYSQTCIRSGTGCVGVSLLRYLGDYGLGHPFAHGCDNWFGVVWLQNAYNRRSFAL